MEYPESALLCQKERKPCKERVTEDDFDHHGLVDIIRARGDRMLDKSTEREHLNNNCMSVSHCPLFMFILMIDVVQTINV